MKMSVWSLACQQSVFQRYSSEKHLSQFYPQDGGESQLASKLCHCQPMYRLRKTRTIGRQRYFNTSWTGLQPGHSFWNMQQIEVAEWKVQPIRDKLTSQKFKMGHILQQISVGLMSHVFYPFCSFLLFFTSFCVFLVDVFCVYVCVLNCVVLSCFHYGGHTAV